MSLKFPGDIIQLRQLEKLTKAYWNEADKKVRGLYFPRLVLVLKILYAVLS